VSEAPRRRRARPDLEQHRPRWRTPLSAAWTSAPTLTLSR